MSLDVLQVIKLASLRGGIVSELTAAAQPNAALPAEALQCAGESARLHVHSLQCIRALPALADGVLCSSMNPRHTV